MQEDIGLICKQIGLFSYNKKKKKIESGKNLKLCRSRGLISMNKRRS